MTKEKGKGNKIEEKESLFVLVTTSFNYQFHSDQCLQDVMDQSFSKDVMDQF